MRVLLICSVETSASIIVERMKIAAESKNMELEIEAHNTSEVDSFKDKFDVCLVGPIVKLSINTLCKTLYPTPVRRIDLQTYGLLDGSKVLNQAITLIGTPK